MTKSSTASKPVLESVPPPETPAPRKIPARALPYGFARYKWLPDVISKLIFGAPLAPTKAEWDRVLNALWEGDKEMDKVVDWMFENNPRQSKALFEQALMHGIDSLENPPEVLKSFFAHIDTPPAWLDRQLAEKGVQVSRLPGEVSYFVLRDFALMGGYALFNSMNQTLASTGALGKQTAQRLAETGKWVCDVTTEQGMERFGPGFITTIRVRMVHALVRRNLKLKKDWEWDKWGLPINQIDMLATYLAFGPVQLLGSRLFGVYYSKAESEAFMHLWRYIGWLLGMDEQWLAITEGDGLRKLYHTFMTHRLPDEKITSLGMALRDEPISENPVTKNTEIWKTHPRLAKWLQRFYYHRHISNSALFLGPIQRARLGIPLFALPWYPALSFLPRFLKVTYYKLRGGKTLQAYLDRNRKMQYEGVLTFFGEQESDIIRPQRGHPAHL
ncbi:MAG TPA: oxygenase MpaB family protein [Pseudomonadales bacterium]|nr:oxygenase MpaB family protein [Pseudomonadales bacterium]